MYADDPRHEGRGFLVLGVVVLLVAIAVAATVFLKPERFGGEAAPAAATAAQTGPACTATIGAPGQAAGDAVALPAGAEFAVTVTCADPANMVDLVITVTPPDGPSLGVVGSVQPASVDETHWSFTGVVPENFPAGVQAQFWAFVDGRPAAEPVTLIVGSAQK